MSVPYSYLGQPHSRLDHARDETKRSRSCACVVCKLHFGPQQPNLEAIQDETDEHDMDDFWTEQELREMNSDLEDWE